MVADRIQFMQDIIDGDDSDKKMQIIRDAFVNMMACYNLLLPCDFNSIEARIIEHSNDYNSLKIEISSNQRVIEKAISLIENSKTIPAGMVIDIYQESFCANVIKVNDDRTLFIMSLDRVFF